MSGKSVVFLDRDGTINIDKSYVTNPDDIELIPGAAKAVGDLKRAGFLVVVVTNQSAIARGMATDTDVWKTNAELERQLLAADADARLDLVLYSPDGPDDNSETRKPAIGMFVEAEKSFKIDRTSSWMIGDKVSDVEFGINACLPREHCLLLGSEVSDLVEAVRLILG